MILPSSVRERIRENERPSDYEGVGYLETPSGYRRVYYKRKEKGFNNWRLIWSQIHNKWVFNR